MVSKVSLKLTRLYSAKLNVKLYDFIFIYHLCYSYWHLFICYYITKTNLFGVLKAQGFSNGYLAKVVLSQTFIIALIGTVIGLVLTLITGAFLPSAVPIKFSATTLLIYGVVLIAVSLIGSLFSILTIRKVDPLKAIG